MITDIRYEEGMTETNEQVNVVTDADSYKDKYYDYIDFAEDLRDDLDSCISISRDLEGKSRYVKSGSIVGYYGSLDDARDYFRSVNVQSYVSQNFNESSGDKEVYIGYNWTLRENDAVKDIKIPQSGVL